MDFSGFLFVEDLKTFWLTIKIHWLIPCSSFQLNSPSWILELTIKKLIKCKDYRFKLTEQGRSGYQNILQHVVNLNIKQFTARRLCISQTQWRYYSFSSNTIKYHLLNAVTNAFKIYTIRFIYHKITAKNLLKTKHICQVASERFLS